MKIHSVQQIMVYICNNGDKLYNLTFIIHNSIQHILDNVITGHFF